MNKYKDQLLNTSINNEDKQVNYFIEKLKEDIKCTREKLNQSPIQRDYVDIELDNNDLLEIKELLDVYY